MDGGPPERGPPCFKLANPSGYGTGGAFLKRWVQSDPKPAPPLAGYSRLQQKLLGRRGLRTVGDVEAFLDRSYTEGDDPFALSDMDRAVDRIAEAKRLGQRVVVHGDYDADGVTGTALLHQALSTAEIDVGWYIPNRFQEGYGLNNRALSRLRSEGTDLLITVDCGIRSVEVVAKAQKSGLDIIVTDHHLPGTDLPPALAVIDPNRQGDAYPFKDLAGVGLAYKLAQAATDALNGGAVDRYLDLVAVGTVADLAVLLGENRSLVGRGIEQLNTNTRPGLRALAEFAGYRDGAITASSLGFGLGPRLNAAGRLADAGLAVELLLATSGPRAWDLAGKLDQLNLERQDLTVGNLETARELADLEADIMVIFDEGFHEGVTGLVAGRLSDERYRPVLVGKVDGPRIRGSARSIPEFHITEALEQCSDLLVKYGGHAQAAGFTLEVQNRSDFIARMEELAEQELGDTQLQPTLEIDATVDFDELDDSLMAFIDRLQPCGMGNPYPILSTPNVTVLSKRMVGKGRRHLKLSLRQSGKVFDAIGFGLGDRADSLPRTVELAYRLERNEFRGVVSLQLNVLDLRPN